MKTSQTKAAMVSVAVLVSVFLIGSAYLQIASAQTSGNMTESFEQAIQSNLQSSPQQLPVQENSHVFVIICTDPSNADTCKAYDLRPLQ